MKKLLPISSCLECPHRKEANPWSSDGWDRMIDWICQKANNKTIAGAVEFHEERKIKIPNWCPLEEKKK